MPGRRRTFFSPSRQILPSSLNSSCTSSSSRYSRYSNTHNNITYPSSSATHRVLARTSLCRQQLCHILILALLHSALPTYNASPPARCTVSTVDRHWQTSRRVLHMHVNGLGMPHFLRRIRGGGGDRPAVERVCVVGSGNWGSTVARIIGQNTEKLGKPFDVKVKMWVYEEEVEGRKLSEIINTQHENVKYLPGLSPPSSLPVHVIVSQGVKLPSNVIAVPDLAEAATAATVR
eukprot:755698-Hanusia_phi.AAC.5